MSFLGKKKDKIVSENIDVLGIQQIMYQDIFAVIKQYLPENWKKVAIFDMEINTTSEIKFYVDFGEGYKDCFDLYSSENLDNIFDEIRAITRPVNNKLPQKYKWCVIKMFITVEQEMNVEYEYNNILENSIDYLLNFEKSLGL